MEANEGEFIAKKTSLEKYEQLMKECRELQEKQKARVEKQKQEQEVIQNVQANAQTALENYEEFKQSIGEALDKAVEVIAENHEKKYKNKPKLDAIEEGEEY